LSSIHCRQSGAVSDIDRFISRQNVIKIWTTWNCWISFKHLMSGNWQEAGLNEWSLINAIKYVSACERSFKGVQIKIAITSRTESGSARPLIGTKSQFGNSEK
jgi:hypothetical protein